MWCKSKLSKFYMVCLGTIHYRIALTPDTIMTREPWKQKLFHNSQIGILGFRVD